MKVTPKTLPKSVEATGITRTCLQINYEGHRLHTDEPPSRGGTDVGPPPFDSFVAMLTGCSHVILGLIADELGVRVADMKMSLDTALDARGIYGMAEVTRPIERIDFRLDFATNANDDQLAAMKATLRKRCPVNVVMTQAGIEIVEHWTTRPLA
ncbi:MAG: OsmC family protein [Alphaproteobacteria bacterium]